ncbi:kinase-like domain-containing protein [Rhizophagus irregularis DAOM 181602=DAOM 197198]|nr:kinase-like domain-containing protein [Rhizophagus irregularis DAOM 181602=DAOM 197198]
MDEVKLISDDVFEQIKDFNPFRLTEEQRSLVNKLITDEELKENYAENGLCRNCKQPKRIFYQCSYCMFQQNFKNWTSGNHEIDEFIKKAQLKADIMELIVEWIEYDKFENVEYLAKGGFGITFKAVWKDGPICNCNNNQWEREGETKVALKCLYNSQGITTDFLKEVESNILVYWSGYTVRCFDIHDKGLIHHDFHCGNILNDSLSVYITDLGLCQPVNVKSYQNSNKKIYGVLPYVAPEVLRGKEYTQASDIYGYGIIAYEICTGFPPYYDIAHDELLAMKICKGLRPKSNYKIPQSIFAIINQCWDADPLKRPNADELYVLINKKLSSSMIQSSLSSTSNLLYTTHPQAVYTSKLLDFKNLPEPKNAENDDLEYSDEWN